MTFTELELPGVFLIEANVFSDERGALRRSFCSDEFRQHGLTPTVVQGNVSENIHAGTLRGFHFQTSPSEEAKTLSCLTGGLFDVIVDLRENSPTFMKWTSVVLSAEARNSLHVPAGCANAFLTQAPHTTVHYYMSSAYEPSRYRGFRYNDLAFGVRWPHEPHVISDRDRSFADFTPSLLT